MSTGLTAPTCVPGSITGLRHGFCPRDWASVAVLTCAVWFPAGAGAAAARAPGRLRTDPLSGHLAKLSEILLDCLSVLGVPLVGMSSTDKGGFQPFLSQPRGFSVFALSPCVGRGPGTGCAGGRPEPFLIQRERSSTKHGAPTAGRAHPCDPRGCTFFLGKKVDSADRSPAASENRGGGVTPFTCERDLSLWN